MVWSGGYLQALHRHQDAPMANDEHVAILKKGVATWNKWRNQNPDIRPDLAAASLSEANLSGVDSTKHDLRGAVGANLSDAILSGADLTKADLRGADLTKADLRGADLSGARLHKSN